MKTELKKLIAFGVIISFLTSAYTAFLKTIMDKGFSSNHFLSDWLKQIPQFYLFILPFVLITGPPIMALVDRIFRNKKEQSKRREKNLT